MEVFSPHRCKFIVTNRIRNSKQRFWIDHDLAAAHVIIDALFEGWNERPRINIIKVNQLISSNTKLVIAFCEIDKTSNIKRKILLPLVGCLSLIQITMPLLEEYDPVG